MELALDVQVSISLPVAGMLFQSLFSWNLLLMQHVRDQDIQEGGFQSLFSWNLLLMLRILCHLGRTSIVSILVFVELALDGQLICSGGHLHRRVSILVFVELALDARLFFVLFPV